MVLLRRRAGRTGLWLALMILAGGAWAGFDAIELQAVTVAGKRVVSQLQYIAVVSAAPCFVHAAFALARRDHRLARGARLAVWLVPAATLLIAWTSSWHDLLWRTITIPDRTSNLGVYEYGWWFWLFAFHAYALLAVATFTLLAATRRVTQPFRVPLSALLVAVLLPWLGNIAYVFKLGPVPGLNWFSISILLSGCILAWITSQKALLDLLPHARDALVETMRDAVIVCDEGGGVVYANRSARALLWADGAAEPRLPQPLQSADLAPAGEESVRAEITMELEERPRWLEVRSDAIRDRWREIAGRILVVRDITERKALESEKDRLITELATAVGTVSKLEAILPTCAGCKRIREAEDTWAPLDDYVRRRAGVAFSHGFCPDCMQRLYGDVLQG